MSGLLIPVEPIGVTRPSPSLLTSARDRTADGFGAGAPEPVAGVNDSELVSRHRWTDGMAWSQVSCLVSDSEADCTDYDPAIRTLNEAGTPLAGTAAFNVYTPLSCDWVDPSDHERMRAAVRDLTAARQAWYMARALWLGEGLPATVFVNGTEQLTATLRNGAFGKDVSIGGAAADLDDVVAVLLSNYAQATGGLGGATLHVPQVLMPGAEGGIPNGGRVATKEGNLYRGPLGSVVSPGPGYPHGASVAGTGGYGPRTTDDDDFTPEYKGNALTEAWVYVSGPVEYALTEVRALPEEDLVGRFGLGRANVYELWGEGRGIVRFDPCTVYAALAANTAGAVS